VLAAEHRAYPLALRLIATGKARVEGEAVRLQGEILPETFIMNPQAG
jgi:phosphoribosylglycinamide formyltransferase-1